MRAGKITSGEEAVIKSMQAGKVKVLFIAKDASDSTKDKMEKKAFFYHVMTIGAFTAEELSKAIGKLHRRTVGVCDDGFAQMIAGYTERGDLHEG